MKSFVTRFVAPGPFQPQQLTVGNQGSLALSALRRSGCSHDETFLRERIVQAFMSVNKCFPDVIREADIMSVSFSLYFFRACSSCLAVWLNDDYIVLPALLRAHPKLANTPIGLSPPSEIFRCLSARDSPTTWSSRNRSRRLPSCELHSSLKAHRQLHSRARGHSKGHPNRGHRWERYLRPQATIRRRQGFSHGDTAGQEVGLTL
jgi:hypothetical protein